jgi:hypothetical protein
MFPLPNQAECLCRQSSTKPFNIKFHTMNAFKYLLLASCYFLRLTFGNWVFCTELTDAEFENE